MIKICICKECGKEFLGGPRAWYCPLCRIERQREQNRVNEYLRRRKMVREIGSIDTCAICGNPYTVKGGLQKYCNNCAGDAIMETDRKQGLKYYHGNKEKINEQRRGKRGNKKCQTKNTAPTKI